MGYRQSRKYTFIALVLNQSAIRCLARIAYRISIERFGAVGVQIIFVPAIRSGSPFHRRRSLPLRCQRSPANRRQKGIMAHNMRRLPRHHLCRLLPQLPRLPRRLRCLLDHLLQHRRSRHEGCCESTVSPNRNFCCEASRPIVSADLQYCQQNITRGNRTGTWKGGACWRSRWRSPRRDS